MQIGALSKRFQKSVKSVYLASDGSRAGVGSPQETLVGPFQRWTHDASHRTIPAPTCNAAAHLINNLDCHGAAFVKLFDGWLQCGETSINNYRPLR